MAQKIHLHGFRLQPDFNLLTHKGEQISMRFQCQQCGAILELDDGLPGELVECDTCGAAVSVPETPVSPRAILGEFVIRRELGTGGMGTVYLAHQITLDRDVALKVLDPELSLDEEFSRSFLNEARAAAAINHPNIIQAYAVKNEGPLWYFAMEYIDGPTVKTLLAEQGKLSVSQVEGIAAEIVSALRYAWNERQIIHCDIKPDNIMVNSSGHAKLADLGLARKCSGRGGEDSDIYGTPQYLAPELMLSKPADARSDIYSLGASFYQMLTGRFPYEGATAEEIVMKHLQVPLTPLRERAPEVPEPLAALVEGMLAKRPAQRYQSYDELASDLERVRSGQMPLRVVTAAAQMVIDVNSPDPLALPEGSATAEPASDNKGHAVRKIKIGAKRNAPSLNSAAIRRDGEEEDDGAVLGGKGAELEHNQRKSMNILLPIIIGVLVLAGAGTYMATRGSSDKGAAEGDGLPQETTVNRGKADADAALQASETAQAESDAMSLDKLKELAEKDSDQVFAEMNGLLAQKAVPPEDVYAAAAPVVEARLAKARQPYLDAEANAWNSRLEAQKKAQYEREAREAAALAAEAKKREAAEAAEKERKRQEERAEAVQKEKLRRIERLHERIAQNKWPSAVMDFQMRFDDEDDALCQWREGWEALVKEAAKAAEAVRTFRADKAAGIEIPVYTLYRQKRGAKTDEDNYETLPLPLVSFDGAVATFEQSNELLLLQLPTIQRLKYDDDAAGRSSFAVSFEQLLPVQQLVILKAALVAKPEWAGESAVNLLGALLVVNGSMVGDVLKTPLFEDFRQSCDILDILKADLEAIASAEHAEKRVKKLEALLEDCRRNPKALHTLIVKTTIRRELSSMIPSFPASEKAIRAFALKFDAFERGN